MGLLHVFRVCSISVAFLIAVTRHEKRNISGKGHILYHSSEEHSLLFQRHHGNISILDYSADQDTEEAQCPCPSGSQHSPFYSDYDLKRWNAAPILHWVFPLQLMNWSNPH